MRRRFARDERGAVALLTALCATLLLGGAAIGVDVGTLFLKGRELQGVADLAALASVQALDPTATTTPAEAATASAAANPWPGGIVAAATPGLYVADPATPAAARFSVGGASPNAVKVTLSATTPLYFAALIIGHPSARLVRTATAARAQFAAFSIGSGLASLDGGVANRVLSAMTGSQVSLSAMDYEALAGAQVDLLKFMPALQTRAGLQGLSYGQTLSAVVQPAQVLQALADTLDAGGAMDAAAAAQAVAASAGSAPATPLSATLDLGPYAAQDHALDAGGAALEVNALELADAVIAAAASGRQLSVSLNGATPPGLATLSLQLAIGQRPSRSPWLTVTDAGRVIVRTAQMRLYLQAGLSAPAPLAATLGSASVQLPIYLESASGAATLQDIDCPETPSAQAFDLMAAPSLGTIALASADPSALANFAGTVTLRPAILAGGALLQATGYGRVDLSGGAWQAVRFTQADVATGAVRQVFATDLASAATASLLRTATISVQTAGGGVSLPASSVSPALTAVLLQAAPALDQAIAEVEAVTGARLGEADVWANGLRCRGAALVA